MDIDNKCDYISSKYWDGNDFCQTRKAATDKYSSIDGLKSQDYDNTGYVLFFTHEYVNDSHVLTLRKM